MPVVLNKAKHGLPTSAVFVGRPSKYGNKFVIGRDGTREQVLQKHKVDLLSDPHRIRDIIYSLRGKDLVCYCKPLACHADLLLRIANARLRVLVCGGRSFTDRKTVNKVLDRFRTLYGNFGIAHGCASGADTLADLWARQHNINPQRFPALWDTYDLSAGPIRNTQMLTEYEPDYVIAFPGGKGTADMCKQAHRARIRVLQSSDIIEQSDPLL